MSSRGGVHTLTVTLELVGVYVFSWGCAHPPQLRLSWWGCTSSRGGVHTPTVTLELVGVYVFSWGCAHPHSYA